MSDIANPGAVAPEGPNPEESAEAVIQSVEGAAPVEEVDQEAVEAASDEELADVLEDSDSTEEEVEAAKEELAKRISMKVNGKEEEFDLSNDDHIERLREMAQKGEGADQKFQEAAKMRKQMEDFAKLMQDDPFKALEKLGHDPDSIAESHLQKKLEQMAKSPEQLEREAIQKELEEIRAEKERLENEKIEAEKLAVQESYSRKLDQEITEGLQNSEMPKSPYVVKRLAEAMIAGVKRDPKYSVNDALPIVERQIKSEIQQMFEAMPEETVEKILGQKVSNKLRKRRLSRMKKSPDTAASVKQTGKSEIKASQPKAPKEPKKAKDFFKSFGDL